MERGDDGDPPLPQLFRPRQLLQQRDLPGIEVLSDDVLRGKIDEIPVVDPAGVGEVGTVNPVTPLLVAALVPVDEEEQRNQSLLMPWRREELERRVVIECPVLLRQRAHLRHGQAEKLVAFAVLTRPCLEKAQRTTGALRCSHAPQLALDVGQGRRLVSGGYVFAHRLVRRCGGGAAVAVAESANDALGEVHDFFHAREIYSIRYVPRGVVVGVKIGEWT